MENTINTKKRLKSLYFRLSRVLNLFREGNNSKKRIFRVLKILFYPFLAIIAVSFIIDWKLIKTIPLLFICIIFADFIVWWSVNLPNLSINFIPRFLRRECESFKELFISFTHIGYVIGVTLFAFLFTLLLSIIILIVPFFILEPLTKLDVIKGNITELLTYTFLFNSMVFTIFYFLYHIVIQERSIKLVRARVQFYLAFSGTISALLFFIFSKNISIPLLISLGVSYLWLNYLLGRMDAEEEAVESLGK